jgi:hypothetical protein
MRVHALQTKVELQRYVEFAHQVYRRNSYWVPPDTHYLLGLLTGELPVAASAKSKSFWVEDGDRLLARVTAVVSDNYNRHWNERMGHLLFFEALPEQDAAVHLLFQTAHDWLRHQGSETIRLSMLLGW